MTNVAFDIDNTLTKPDLLFKTISDYFRIDIAKVKSPSVLKHFNILDGIGIDKVQQGLFWEDNMDDLISYAPVSDSLHFMFNTYVKPSDTVFIITDRPNSKYDLTYQWLSAYLVHRGDKTPNIDKKTNIVLPYFDLLVTGNGGYATKTQLIKNLHIDIFFDDKPDLFTEVYKQRLNTDAFVIDRPWNVGVPSDKRINPKTGLIIQEKSFTEPDFSKHTLNVDSTVQLDSQVG